ncbi:hypothetical protein ACFRCW_38325 [Streptomyces sp. NPDC056653]
MGAAERRELVVGIDPAKDWHLPLAWAVDEAHRRGLLHRAHCPVITVPLV